MTNSNRLGSWKITSDKANTAKSNMDFLTSDIPSCQLIELEKCRSTEPGKIVSRVDGVT